MIFVSDVHDKEYFDYLVNRSPIEKAIRKLLYWWLPLEVKDKVLDAGCGIGEMTERIPNCVGIDINKYCVDYCKSKGLIVYKADILNTPFKDKSFDTVICFHVLEHLKRPEDAIKEMYRTLKLNGKLIIVVPTECGYRKDKTHKTFLLKETLKELLIKNNFKIKRIYYYPFSSKFFRERLPMNVLRVIAIKEANSGKHIRKHS